VSKPKSKKESPLLEAFRTYLSEEGLKATRQRTLIVKTFGDLGDHVSVEDLLAAVKERDEAIGYATVYRTLKLLVDGGLASIRHFGDGFARFEPRLEEHHDHLICEECGKILEFHDEGIERLQVVLAKRLGFRLTRHRHELYGLCEDCR